jgi:ABC-type nitrate/sulfonate/bicarbonate transport system substrate-binding protein
VILTAATWSLVAPTKARINSIKDLKGKTIGISGDGSSSDMLTRYSLRKAGLDPDKEVTLIALGSVANLFAGVESDRVNEAGGIHLPRDALQRFSRQRLQN